MNGPDRWLDLLHKGTLPSKADIIDLCERARELFSKEANVAKVSSPVTVVGDLHGQFYDLKELLEVGGECPTANYLFLGDYVDRGYYSLETLLLLLGLKVRWPSRVTMLRGNHETRQITQVYGFYDECMRKFGSSEIWSVCCEVFDTMPLAALVVDYGAFGVHAGLSPSLDTIDQIEQLERHKEVPHEGPMCDLLWSDPEDMAGWGVSQRGAGYVFGEDIVEQFNHTNDLAIVCRSHQLVMEGYKEFASGGLVTVWSAPNYCYRCGNDAAILTFESHPAPRKQYSTFKAAPEEVRQKPPECGGKEVRSLPDYFL